MVVPLQLVLALGVTNMRVLYLVTRTLTTGGCIILHPVSPQYRSHHEHKAWLSLTRNDGCECGSRWTARTGYCHCFTAPLMRDENHHASKCDGCRISVISDWSAGHWSITRRQVQPWLCQLYTHRDMHSSEEQYPIGYTCSSCVLLMTVVQWKMWWS